MENLDLNSIQKTEVLVSSAAKDKILIKPKRTSTRQPARKQQDATRPVCLPKLAEETRSKPVVLRGSHDSVSGEGTSDEAVILSSGKPQLPTLTSGQTKVDTSPGGLTGSKIHLPVFSATVRGNQGERLPAPPASATSPTLTALSAVTTPASPGVQSSCKTVGMASLIPQLVSASSHVSTASGATGVTLHHASESSTPAATLPSSQTDSHKAAGEIKTEINIKSMMNRFQPPASNKSSPCRTAVGTELDTNVPLNGTEIQPRQWTSHQVVHSAHDDRSIDSWVAAPSTRHTTKLEHTNLASIDSLAASAHEAPWLRKKKELLVGNDSNKSATATSSLTGAHSSVVKSTTATTVCPSSTQDNTQRVSSTLSDQPSSLEPKSQGLQKNGSNINTDQADCTNLDSHKTTGYQVNSMKTSRSFFDCSSRLNMQPGSLTANTSKSTPHLKFLSMSQAASPGQEADRKPLKSDSEASRTQRHIGMSAFHNKDAPVKAVSPVYSFNLPSASSASNQTCTSVVASNSDNAGASPSSAGAAAPPVKQPAGIHPSLVESVNNTAHLASLAKPAGVCSQPSATAAASMSAGAPRFPTGHSKSATFAAHISGLGSKFGSPSFASSTSARVAPAVPSVSASTAASTPSSASTDAPVIKLPSAQVYKPHIPPATQTASSIQTLPTTSANKPHTFGTATKPSGRSTAGVKTHIEDKATDAGVKVPPWRASQLMKDVLMEDKATDAGVKVPPWRASQLMKDVQMEDKATDAGVKVPPWRASQLMKDVLMEDKATDAGVKVPPWRASQLMKDVQVEIIDRKACNHGNMLEPSKKTHLATDTAIIEQTDKLCGKPSKVLHMVKNFQNCQVPS